MEQNHFSSLEKNKYDIIKTEYIIMRKEIASQFSRKWKLEIALLSAYSIILSYLLTEPEVEPYAFLLPVILVLCCYKIDHDISLSIWKGASYCIAYFYKYGFIWEKVLKLYRDEEIKSSRIVFLSLRIQEFYPISLCLICIFICLMRADFSLNYIVLCSALTLLIFCFFIFRNYIGMPHYSRIFPVEIERWNKALKKLDEIAQD